MVFLSWFHIHDLCWFAIILVNKLQHLIKSNVYSQFSFIRIARRRLNLVQITIGPGLGSSEAKPSMVTFS